MAQLERIKILTIEEVETMVGADVANHSCKKELL